MRGLPKEDFCIRDDHSCPTHDPAGTSPPGFNYNASWGSLDGWFEIFAMWISRPSQRHVSIRINSGSRISHGIGFRVSKFLYFHFWPMPT